jgi:peptidoglycan/xylan/chitin deacetylase (PgdA/CDA1 family)
MGLRAILGGARRQLLSRVARREARLNNERPLISFTFDDFPKSALFTGGAILAEQRLSGTYYAAPGLIGTSTEVGPIFEPSDLQHLLEAGHELASHTYSHISSRKTSLSAYFEDARKGEQELGRYVGRPGLLNFSYPFGDVTIEAKKKIGPAMRSCRGIFPGLDGPVVDLNLLHANSLYGADERFTAAESLIQENARQNSWLIFYTHDVQQEPSPYGCTPRLFERVVACAIKSGAEILTVASALRKGLSSSAAQ